MADTKKITTELRDRAAKKWTEFGKIEIDDNAKVSISYDETKDSRPIQGGYVQAWVWVDYKEKS